ncbi:ATP-binding cassette domain-containing protein [Anaerobacillus sp. HL2]|nr:ATP-binding cassette domain-containing protein [Anaerobacillus sp. HL2]
MKIKSGQRVAFVGKKWVWKINITKTHLRFDAVKYGEIIVNGVPLTQLEEDNWFKQVSYVSQEPYLFSGTIKENIMLGNMEASDEEIY